MNIVQWKILQNLKWALLLVISLNLNQKLKFKVNRFLPMVWIKWIGKTLPSGYVHLKDWNVGHNKKSKRISSIIFDEFVQKWKRMFILLVLIGDQQLMSFELQYCFLRCPEYCPSWTSERLKIVTLISSHREYLCSPPVTYLAIFTLFLQLF